MALNKPLSHYIQKLPNYIAVRCVNFLAPVLPDAVFLKLLFRLNMGKSLNLKNPHTFNEKLQWLKLFDRRPEYSVMVDKYAVKKFVADKIGEEYVIPTLGVWDTPEDIEWDNLPEKFVLKCTHDSGGLVICKDKNTLDKDAAIKTLKKALRNNYYIYTREWPYKNVPRKIIAEKYMQEGANLSLTDYKFYCFNGEVKFLYVSNGLENHSTAQISFLTKEWQFAPFGRSDYAPFTELPEKPSRFNEMLQIASKLSYGHVFLRVDLYQINGKIYFSELTFHPCSGMMPFEPDEWDKYFGDMLTLPYRKI